MEISQITFLIGPPALKIKKQRAFSFGNQCHRHWGYKWDLALDRIMGTIDKGKISDLEKISIL